jgi:hypothetical protein
MTNGLLDGNEIGLVGDLVRGNDSDRNLLPPGIRRRIPREENDIAIRGQRPKSPTPPTTPRTPTTPEAPETPMSCRSEDDECPGTPEMVQTPKGPKKKKTKTKSVSEDSDTETPPKGKESVRETKTETKEETKQPRRFMHANTYQEGLRHQMQMKVCDVFCLYVFVYVSN